jgi:hypothetical protein
MERFYMSDSESLSDKEILNKFGQVIMELVHKKTCQNIQWILSGYSNPTDSDAELFLEYAKLDDCVKSVINKLLLVSVNKAIANFLFVLSDFDRLGEYRDSIAINTYYVDREGNKKRIVEIYDNWSGIFSCEWKEQSVTFKNEIAPENPRRIEHIKVFPSTSKNIDELVTTKQSVSQFDIENMMAEVREKTKREMSSLLGSSYLLDYLAHRFPEMKPEHWNEIEKIGNDNGDRFSNMFSKALESQSLENYIEYLRTL